MHFSVWLRFDNYLVNEYDDDDDDDDDDEQITCTLLRLRFVFIMPKQNVIRFDSKMKTLCLQVI